ncbi:MAG TPA: styrene monooxygenase/indole monooxygenase family protein [Terriglobales bacterium]|nr:styrene monooxygenase/indole monooxygenase family protein [Terriglobales bacterium]
MKRMAIIGAGQSGLQLGLGLLNAGYEVTLYSERSADAIHDGRVMSSQCMFDSALEIERDLGLNYWEEECPKVEGISLAVPDGVGGKIIDWAARLDNFAQSVDQRLKIPRWMAEFQKRGGELRVKAAEIDDLEGCSRTHDLVIVASGKGAISQLFTRDTSRSPFSEPQRSLALTYVRNMRPRAPYAAVCFNLIPNVGEYFVFPALTTSGACEIMVFEGTPGGPMDCWNDVRTASEHLARSKQILDKFLPWEAERCRDVELTDDDGILTGRFAPTVRQPIATLPSGRNVLGMADAIVLNDPLTGQGSNNATRCAEIYLESILERGNGLADAAWMQHTFDRYWTGYAKWVAEWTNLLLKPPGHVLKLLDCAGKISAVASTFVNGFDDPRTLFPWFMDAVEAEAFVQKEAKAVAERFDRRDYRKALGQFATGVTVVTAHASGGRKVGVTVNSFSSVSLDPPLILWSLSRQTPSFIDFTNATHFAVNVLESRQHHLSRQFSTPLPDKFAGVEFEEGTGGVPLLHGAIAQFVCRKLRHYDGGDHVILVGEVEQYNYNEGEPLVFHSGRYRIATRHPDIAE